MKFLKNPKKIMYTPLGILVMKIYILVSLDKYFGDTTNVNFARLTASPRPLSWTPRPGYQKTTISIELKYHSSQKASYRIERGFYTHTERSYF